MTILVILQNTRWLLHPITLVISRLLGRKAWGVAILIALAPYAGNVSGQGVYDTSKTGRDLRLPLSQEDWQYLKTLPELKLGIDPHWAPMAFVNDKGEATGISADYLKYIEKTLHIKLRVVPTHSWSETIQMANDGKIDIVAAVSEHNSLNRQFLFTNAYLNYPIVIVTRSDARFVAGLEDLSGLRAAVIVDSAVGHADSQIWRNIGRINVSNAEDGLQAVEDRGAYAYLGNLGVVDRLVREKYAGTLRIAAPTGYSETLKFGIAPSLGRLRPLINQVLSTIPDQERELIQNSWLSTRLVFGVPSRTLWLVLPPIAGITLLFMVVLGVINSRMRREVKQRRLTEQKLIYQMQFQTLLMNLVPIPIFVKDKEQCYVAVNPAYEEALGIRAEQLVGKTMQLASHLGPADMATLNNISTEVMNTGRPAHGEVQYQSLDGIKHDAIYWVRQCRSEDGASHVVLGAFIDVSTLRTMERREVELKRQLVELTQLLPAVVFQLQYTRREGFHLLFINQHAHTLFGIPESGLAEMPAIFVRQLNLKDRHRLIKALLRSIRQMQTLHCEFQLDDNVHTPIWVRIEAAPRMSADGNTIWSGYLSNVTKAREENAALTAAKQEAEDASRAKDMFLATVSHEIRTPMSGVVGILQLMDHGQLSPDDQHLVNMARNAAEILVRILNDILDFAKNQNEELKLETSPMQIREIVDRIAGMMAPEIRRKDLAFEVVVAPDVAPCHIGDAQRLGQVLLNLLSNAIKFTETGKISLAVEASAARDGRQELIFQVTDTGIGIDPADQARLFSPFTQVSAATSRHYGGTGLGLAICKRLIESMGGSIALQSAAGDGTAVIAKVLLPIDHVKAAAKHASIEKDFEFAVSQIRQDESSAPILLVEDQSLNRELLARQMLSLRFTACDAVANGAEALEAMAVTNYHMIITDCAMPVIGGVELISRIRQQEKISGEHIPIVALTANASYQQYEECAAAGADAVMVKPVDLDQLAQFLRKFNIAAPAVEEFAKAGISTERHTELWAKFQQTLMDDMGALLGHLRELNLSAARDIAHRILGAASWFRLPEVAREAQKLEECLARGTLHDASVCALQTAISHAMTAPSASLQKPESGAI